MFIYILRRTTLMIILLAGGNFFAFTYAHYGRYAQMASNPIFAQTGKAEPVTPLYKEYAAGFFNGNPVQMPSMRGVSILKAIGTAAKASLGLLSIAFVLSMVIGFVLGTNAARTAMHISFLMSWSL